MSGGAAHFYLLAMLPILCSTLYLLYKPFVAYVHEMSQVGSVYVVLCALERKCMYADMYRFLSVYSVGGWLSVCDCMLV